MTGAGEECMDNSNKIIYCQRDIPKEKLRYGFRSSAATGCGWIATYNALKLMGYKPNAKVIIKYYERQIPVINGNAGTFLLSPLMFFKKQGFSVKSTASRRHYDELAKQSDVCILFFWWKKGFKIGAHFVALQHTPKGFVGYNTYSNSKGPDYYGTSIEKYLEKKKYFGTVLMGIKDKK